MDLDAILDSAWDEHEEQLIASTVGKVRAQEVVEESASRVIASDAQTDVIKEAGEQSAVVAAPMKRCEGCGKSTRIKCSKCNFFAYCSKRCQVKLWPRQQVRV